MRLLKGGVLKLYCNLQEVALRKAYAVSWVTVRDLVLPGHADAHAMMLDRHPPDVEGMA